MHYETGILKPTPPFDFAKSLDFLENFPAMQGSEIQADIALTRAVSISDKPIVFRVKASGTIKQPRLKYILHSEASLSGELKEKAVDRVAFFLSLDDDLGPFYHIAASDPEFAPVVRRSYGLHQVKFLTPFESACWAVLSQHNLMTLARKTKEELAHQFGRVIDVEGQQFTCFPDSSYIANVPREDVEAVVRNSRRTDHLVNVAKAFASVDEKFLRNSSYDQVEDWLRGIKGIGEWSARLIMLRGLGRMEKLAVEKRLIEAASSVYAKNRTLGPDELHSIAEKYGPRKGYWAYYLRAAALDPD